MSIKYNGKLIAGKYKTQIVTDATESNKGLIKIATQEEVNTGTDNTTAVTPKDLATKQNIISDINTIRAGATLGSTALQSIPDEYITETELNAKGYLTSSSLPVGSDMQEGIVQVDGTTITAEDGVISAVQQDLSPYLTKNDAMTTYETVENAMSVQEELQSSINTKANINLDNLSEQGLKVIKDNSGSGLEICDIGTALYVDETKGLRRYLNGQIVDINANTQAFLDRLKQITTLHPSLLCTEDEWQTAKTMSVFGQVGKFVFNYSGETVVSVRIPRVVNIQGVFDLQNLGLTVAAGLPTPSHTHTRGSMNITGSFTTTDTWGNYCQGYSSGAFTNWNASRRNLGGSNNQYENSLGGLSFDASRNWSGSTSQPNDLPSIYGNSSTVQPESIQYPYFIQIATGSETENNIVNEIELNNPYSFGDSKYSPIALNNISWLKSEGQWNAKAVYPDYYNWILENVNKSTKGFLGQTMYMWGSASGGYMTTSTTPIVGSAIYNYSDKKYAGSVTAINSETGAISFTNTVNNVSYTDVRRYPASDESSSAYITDYDFILNTADETFRLPLLDGSEDLPSDNFLNWTSYVTATETDLPTVPYNGYLAFAGNGTATVGYIFCVDTQLGQGSGQSTVQTHRRDVIFLKKGDRAHTYISNASGVGSLIFVKAQGNGTLYYYVGETVQNANLIDAGRIGEQLATKTNKKQASWYSSPASTSKSISVGSAGSTLIAPGNGEIFIGGKSSAANNYVSITNQSNSNSNILIFNGSNQVGGKSVRCSQGQTIRYDYYGMSELSLRFIPNNGEV